MQEHSATGRSWTAQDLVQGAQVVDANGDKVGTLIQYDQAQGYLMVEKGWLFPQDVYIPVAAINSANAEAITLSYTKQDLQDHDWTTPPAASAPSVATNPPTTQSTAPVTDTMTAAQDIRVPLRKEELVVGKQQQEEGRVHLHKDVVTEQQSVSVPVTHEEMHIEHVAADPNTVVGDDAFVASDIEVPLMGEQVVADKRVKATEEVRVQKKAVTEQQQVSDTVRKERLHVDGDGAMQLDKDIHGDAMDTHEA